MIFWVTIGMNSLLIGLATYVGSLWGAAFGGFGIGLGMAGLLIQGSKR